MKNKMKSFIQYYMNPFSQYNTLSSRDKKDFDLLIKAWHPENGDRGILLRWLMTTWCNYRCPYCDQQHKKSSNTHAFDNHDVATWLSYFDKHFHNSKLSLVITGGETFIDTKNMPYFLNALTERDYVNTIRMDTNASWNPVKYKGVDTSKIWLMCTFHPSGVQEDAFIEKIRVLLDHGYKIGMVNYVMYENQVEKFEERMKIFSDMGVPLHPNPLWDSKGEFTEDALSIMKKYLHPLDLKYRGGASPYNKKCFFPSVSYEMTQTGKLYVGCHPSLAGNFFNDKIPKLPAGPVRCPSKSCKCLDKYSFLKGFNRNTTLNPFQRYHELLMERNLKT